MKPVYMITGTNRGIGFALTRQVLSKGYQVIATARNVDNCEELQNLSKQFPEQLHLAWLDVTSESSVTGCFTAIRNQGINSIDVLINNAGVYGNNHDRFLKLPVHSLINTFQVNTLGPMRVLQEGLSFLQKSELGKMVSITSKMGSIADNKSGGSYDYRMSKAALNMFHANLAREFPEMVSLVLHPGWVKTDMGGPQAPLSTEESARGLLGVIEKATSRDSGKFLDYQGEVIPW